MASINFELNELVDILSKSVKMPEQVNQICCEYNKIKITISPGILSPNFNLFLTYNKFYKGKVVFNVSSKGPTELIISLLDRLGFSVSGNSCEFNSKQFTVDINDYLKDKFNFIEIKDIISNSGSFSIII
ncbi:hypothetical protein JMF89_09910 [Clostridiaceae bacterium UIB06]|uniref:Uncharacterized protein n=1 Tax=Clostridium thailandense TaxID=2794346 RepID=A0A949TX54_9CLOT|nr:hypothetical protein [Clostridium thailandense]MBV7273160.1 hypothetical protein [Clostridium thailandense]MCH5137514.1 hypothetical protein [Clostridiaceae bacterium UIB06]